MRIQPGGFGSRPPGSGATLGGGIAVGPLLSSVLAQRMITRHRLVLGLAVCLLGLLWLARLSPAAGWAQLLPGMVVTGLGTGLTNAALGQLAVSSAPADQPGPGIGANNTARYLGGAAGIAIVVALAVPTSARPTTSQFVAGWDTAAARGCPGCPWHAAWPALARS